MKIEVRCHLDKGFYEAIFEIDGQIIIAWLFLQKGCDGEYVKRIDFENFKLRWLIPVDMTIETFEAIDQKACLELFGRELIKQGIQVD